jgi:uncharacterized protein
VILSAGMPERAVEVAGETLIARADRSLFWPRQSTLFIADVHFGKAATFRAASLPIPVGTTGATLERLRNAICETSAQRLIFLGDLWHAKEGRREEIFESLQTWRKGFASTEMILVEGNHDRRSGALPAELRIRLVNEPYIEHPFALCHYPCEVSGAYCLAGHIHPAISLRARAKQSLRLPCFWFGEHCCVLPAFGEFTGTATINAMPGDCVIAIAEDGLHPIPNQSEMAAFAEVKNP